MTVLAPVTVSVPAEGVRLVSFVAPRCPLFRHRAGKSWGSRSGFCMWDLFFRPSFFFFFPLVPGRVEWPTHPSPNASWSGAP